MFIDRSQISLADFLTIEPDFSHIRKPPGNRTATPAIEKIIIIPIKFNHVFFVNNFIDWSNEDLNNLLRTVYIYLFYEVLELNFFYLNVDEIKDLINFKIFV